MSEWISVKDRLPEIDKMLGTSEKVLIASKIGYCRYWIGRLAEVKYWAATLSNEADANTETGWIDVYGRDLRGENVTHWMPLTEPPKEVRSGVNC